MRKMGKRSMGLLGISTVKTTVNTSIMPSGLSMDQTIPNTEFL